MLNFKLFAKKSWIFAAAAAVIVGSTTVMAFALNSTIPENATSYDAASVKAATVSSQGLDTAAKTAPVYTLIDNSKQPVDMAQLKEGINKQAQGSLTHEQLESISKNVVAKMTPGEKDMTAEQAAAKCADFVQKAYGIDFTGLTAEASFSKNSVPNSDNWKVIFHASNEVDGSVRYYASVNSVSGAMLDAGCYDLTNTESHNTDLSNPDWMSTAEKDISVLLPSNVTITGSKTVFVSVVDGVDVVCNLSDGSAYAVRLTGESKTAVAYISFPNGYDGSLDLGGIG